MRVGNYGLEILVDGKPLAEISDGDSQRVEVNYNIEFSLRISNFDKHSTLVVPSVDGLSVMNGKPASYNSGGYILAPNGVGMIVGWRLNNYEVAKFIFGRLHTAYAAEMGHDKSSIGFLGAAFFRERVYSNTELQTTLEEAAAICSNPKEHGFLNAHDYVRRSVEKRYHAWRQAADFVPPIVEGSGGPELASAYAAAAARATADVAARFPVA